MLLPIAPRKMESNCFFLQNRLDCAVENSKSRRYSKALFGMTCVWNSSFSSLYKQILNEGVLNLPSIRTINRLSSALNVDTGFKGRQSPKFAPFFNLRNRISFKNLNEQKNPHQKLLSFDEVMACQSSPFFGPLKNELKFPRGI